MGSFNIGSIELNRDGSFGYEKIQANLERESIQIYTIARSGSSIIDLTPAQAKEFGMILVRASTAHADMVQLMEDLERRTEEMTQETLSTMAKLTHER